MGVCVCMCMYMYIYGAELMSIITKIKAAENVYAS